MNSMFENCCFRVTFVRVPRERDEVPFLSNPWQSKKRGKKNCRVHADSRPPPSISLPHPLSLSYFKDMPALAWPWPPEGAFYTSLGPVPELSSTFAAFTKGDPKGYRAENILKKIKAPSKEELKCVSTVELGGSLVSFIKAAIGPITYHQVFFTAMSWAAIIEGNRFILWAQRQDRDGWWKLQASSFQHHVANL